MVAPLPNERAVIEPFFQELLRLKRIKGLHPRAQIFPVQHQSRSFAAVVLDLLDAYRALPYPKPRLSVVVSERTPSGVGAFERF